MQQLNISFRPFYRYLLIPLIFFLLLCHSVYSLECNCSNSTCTVIDKLGRKVEIKVPVKRAIIVTGYDLIPALDIWDEVIGVSRWADDVCGVYRTFIKKYPYLKKPHVGTGSDVDVESILRLNPDVIITWTYEPDVITFLENKGIKVVGVYPDSISEVYQLIYMYGKLFGKEKRAEEIIYEMNKMLRLVNRNVSNLNKEQRKKVLYLGSRPTRLSAGIGVTNEAIKIAGGINLAGSINKRYVDVSMETIIRLNPDIIFIWSSASYDESWLYNSSQWRYVKAVRMRHVYKLPHWSNWSPDLVPFVLYMATKMYPDRFHNIDFNKTVDGFYKKVFGISFFSVNHEKF